MGTVQNETVREYLADSEMVLIGLGEEFRSDGTSQTDDHIIHALNQLTPLLKGKTYFIISQNRDDLPFRTSLLSFFISAPLSAGDSNENTEKQWDTYLRWVAGTLGHRLLIMELGVGFDRPDLIRWPFEKMAQMNLKSTFLRINDRFPQLPKELAATRRAFSVKENAVDWIENLCKT